MKSEKKLKKIVSMLVIAGFVFQMCISLPAQSEEEIARQFSKAKARFLSGQYVNAKTRIERIINIIIGRKISRNDILGGCYLLLGAIYEKEDKEVLAEENYRKAKDDYGMMLVLGVELDSLPLYRRIVKGEIPPEEGTIEKEGNKNKKKFPWLLAAAGAVAVGVILYLVLKKPKSKTLTIQLGDGVQGTPGAGSQKYKKGEPVSYSYETLPGYSQLQVTLDNNVVDPSGQIKMDKDHTIVATASANTIEFITNTTSLDIPEGNTASFQIKLSAQPRSDVNVTVAHAGGDTDITVLPVSLTYTPTNWNSFKTVTLSAAEDSDALNGEATIRISAPDITSTDITATEIDNDTLSFLIDPSSLSIPEGSSGIVRVKLSAKPSGTITAQVNRIGNDNDIIVSSGNTLKFDGNNWNRNQNIILSALQDSDVENGTTSFRISAAGVSDKEFTVTEIDDDGLGFIVKPNENPLKIEEGGTLDLQITLSAKPSSNITANVTKISGDEDITIQSGANLTFTSTNYNQGLIVTLAAGQDVDTQQGTATFKLSAPGTDLADKEFNVQEIDNDALQFVTDTNEVTVDEGGTATFQVKLSAQPDSEITATASRSSGDTDISVMAGSTLTFNNSNWDSYQTITLQAVRDEDEENGEAEIGISSGSVPTKRVTATENDNYRGAPPDVTLSEPEDQAVVSGEVTIRAFADDDFGVQRVEFYIDDELVETFNQIPYRYTWSTKTAALGTHQIKAIAYDSLEQSAEDVISVTLEDAPPAVSITPPATSPLAGSVIIETHAEDYFGVKAIKIYINDSLVTTWEQSPEESVDFNFQLDTTTYTNGNYTLKAIAIDTSDQESTPAEINITIEN